MSTHSIVPARTPAHFYAVRGLCREYAASLPYSLCFQGIDEELASLPGKYAPPAGQLLIAIGEDGFDATQTGGEAGGVIGCVAMRPLDSSGLREGDPWPACEMKRMYVRPSARGTGLGRRLCERIIEEARDAGYQLMKLDTDTASMQPAIGLYRAMGFKAIPAYNEDPMAGTVWMGLEL